jgi:hypothetical protein
VTLSGANASVTFTDNAAQNSYVKLTDFTPGDTIRVTGATASQYTFTLGDYDGDGVADDLRLAYTNTALGTVNDIQILNLISPSAHVTDQASAIAAAGFNFISFG